MITNDQIAQGAITETKLSKNLRLSHTNIAAVQAGQVLVGNDSGDLSAATMSGDVTISSTGVTTLTDASVLDVVKRLKVLRKQDFSQSNTMLFASYAGQPRAVNINELKILLGIPSTFNSSESEAAFVGTTDQVKTYTADLVWNTATTDVTYAGSGANIVATVSHQLGTSYLISSVLDLNSSTSTYLRLMDIGFDTFVKVIDDKTITIDFDFDSSSLPDYKLTLIGVS